MLLNSVIGAGLFFSLYKILEYKNKNVLFNTIVLLLVFGAVLPYLSFRPVIFSLLFTTIFLSLLDRFTLLESPAFCTGNNSPPETRSRLQRVEYSNGVYFLPFLMILWVNLHPGFIIGLVLIGIFLISNIKNIRFRPLVLSFGFAIIALLFNPFFYKIFSFPFLFLKTFTHLRSISEWGSNQGGGSPFFLIIVILCIISFIHKRPNLESILLFLVFFILGITMVRNIPFFAITSVVVLRELNIAGILKGKAKVLFERFNLSSKPYQGTFIFAITAVMLLLFANPQNFKMELKDYPVKAVDYIKFKKPPGNIFSQEVWSGYLLWELYPQYKVFFDAKGGFGKKQIKDYYQVMKPGPGWQKVLANYGITTILLAPDKPLNLLLKETTDWCLAYMDSCAEVFLSNH